MIFNETLIPQDSFTETNVTRKRSVVGNSYFIPKLIYYKFTFFIYFSFENMTTIIVIGHAKKKLIYKKVLKKTSK